MYRIAAIGDRDSVYGFGVLGIDVIAIEHGENASQKFKKISNGEYAVIYITEALAKELEDEIEKLSDRQLPAIIPIPGVKDNNGVGIANVKKSVEKAVGSDIIFND